MNICCLCEALKEDQLLQSSMRHSALLLYFLIIPILFSFFISFCFVRTLLHFAYRILVTINHIGHLINTINCCYSIKASQGDRQTRKFSLLGREHHVPNGLYDLDPGRISIGWTYCILKCKLTCVVHEMANEAC